MGTCLRTLDLIIVWSSNEFCINQDANEFVRKITLRKKFLILCFRLTLDFPDCPRLQSYPLLENVAVLKIAIL